MDRFHHLPTARRAAHPGGAAAPPRADYPASRRLLSIPGVGPSTAATLMAEIGDIWRFSDVDQLLAYAGVHPKEQSSGKKGANPETSWTMAKTGNAYLRVARIEWPWWASSTTRSSAPTTHANVQRASQR